MKRLVALVGRVFSNDAFVRVLPWLTLGAGLLLFAASYLALPEADYPIWHDAAKTLGQTIIVSGLVGALLNTFKYIGLFREAVHEVIYSPEHLRSRADLRELWSRVTSIICQEKFPDLAPRLEAGVLRNYVPAEKDFYYSQYNRECVLKCEHEDKSVVTIVEEIDLFLHPADPAKEVPYFYRSRSDSRTPRDVALLTLNYLEINGVAIDLAFTVEEYDDEFGGKGIVQSYTYPLQGRSSYRVRRSLTRRLCLDKDPVIEYSSNQFILGCTARFRSEEPTIVPVFQSVGTPDFDDKSLGKKGTWIVDREFNDLMFPRQGYILFIQRRL
jgi:hypothetical protein